MLLVFLLRSVWLSVSLTDERVATALAEPVNARVHKIFSLFLLVMCFPVLYLDTRYTSPETVPSFPKGKARTATLYLLLLLVVIISIVITISIHITTIDIIIIIVVIISFAVTVSIDIVITAIIIVIAIIIIDIIIIIAFCAAFGGYRLHLAHESMKA